MFDKKSIKPYLPTICNGIALAIMFPISVFTFFSIKFWIVLALLVTAVTIARGENK